VYNVMYNAMCDVVYNAIYNAMCNVVYNAMYNAMCPSCWTQTVSVTPFLLICSHRVYYTLCTIPILIHYTHTLYSYLLPSRVLYRCFAMSLALLSSPLAGSRRTSMAWAVSDSLVWSLESRAIRTEVTPGMPC
jgi:hypothetical protein